MYKCLQKVILIFIIMISVELATSYIVSIKAEISKTQGLVIKLNDRCTISFRSLPVCKPKYYYYRYYFWYYPREIYFEWTWPREYIIVEPKLRYMPLCEEKAEEILYRILKDSGLETIRNPRVWYKTYGIRTSYDFLIKYNGKYAAFDVTNDIQDIRWKEKISSRTGVPYHAFIPREYRQVKNFEKDIKKVISEYLEPEIILE